MDTERVNKVRLHVLRTAMNGQGVPSASQAAAALGISEEQAVESYRQLAEGHVYVLEPGDPTRLRMANPFSAVPTAHEVNARGKSYYGNCIWDACGIVSLLGGTGEVHTRCPDCGDPMTLAMADRKLVHKEGVVHFSVPSARSWDDIIFT
ncbi:MAG: hypothetical protein PVS3B2_05230 [Candidatus Dormibacteraceae bacterium]